MMTIPMRALELHQDRELDRQVMLHGWSAIGNVGLTTVDGIASI